MLMMSNSEAEAEEIINELVTLELSHNLRLKKYIPDILTAKLWE